MKTKNIVKLLAVAALGLSGTACNEVLDVNKETELSDVAVWSTPEAADLYITASYKTFSDEAQLALSRSKFWDSYSDIMKSSSWDQYGHPYNSTLLQTTGINADGGAGPFECWASDYVRIRRANVCLRDLREYGKKYGTDWIAPREAEIRLCRAYTYFRLARNYGGIVLRTETSGKNGIDDGAFPEDVTRARLSEADTYKWILNELAEAAKALPAKNSTTWQTGRATSAFAYGLISRIGLYAGQWETAAKAAEEVAKNPNVKLDASYAALFTPEGADSPEYLFCLRYVKGSLTHQWDNSNRPCGDNALNNGGAYGEHQPTAELADLYEWKDGTPFNWNTWSTGHADPFTDREPRFQATVLYNNAKWEDRTIQAWEGGLDGYKAFLKSGSTGGRTCTGYFMRKFLQEGNKSFTVDMSYTPDPVMRYAEVLLNQAEAYAQWDLMANQNKVLACINAVRARVNLPAKTIADVNNLENTMKLIRDERCKELAGEGFRFWDLRRWRMSQQVINGQMRHGVKITKNGTSFTYTRVDCDAATTMFFPERYYYFSIPLVERANNTACTNNPMW